jgi:replicative DNA helicase
MLRDFWNDIINNSDPVQAATRVGILADLERFKDYDSTRVDGYAKQIERFSHLSKVEQYGESLLRAAKEGDDQRIDRTVIEICRNVEPQSGRNIISIGDVAEQVENKIRERAKNPKDVWGIHYAWPYISLLTGGKQLGELVICAGEPGVGKSWWWLQDALETAIGSIDKDIDPTPVYYWCGEMRREQIMRRFYQILGVNGRAMKSGHMTNDDWDLLNEAKAIVMNSPIYIDDRPLKITELKPILTRQIAEHGIKQVVLDYALLIQAQGKDEIERTGNVSTELKRIANDLELAVTLITSVNKQGMDSKNEDAVKSNMRGSGQQIHDADIVYTLTAFNPSKNKDLSIKPDRYDTISTLHISKGRELDHFLEGGFINYERMEKSPKFRELKETK